MRLRTERPSLHLLTRLGSARSPRRRAPLTRSGQASGGQVPPAPARPTVWRGGGGRTFSLIYDTRPARCGYPFDWPGFLVKLVEDALVKLQEN